MSRAVWDQKTCEDVRLLFDRLRDAKEAEFERLIMEASRAQHATITQYLEALEKLELKEKS